MWDRSYRWQRLARVSAGGAALVALLAGLVTVSNTEAADRAAAGVSEISREASPDADSTVVCNVPASLGAKRGVLVYREGQDGKAEIVGRVIGVQNLDASTDTVTVLLTPGQAGAMAHGGKLRGAAPTISLEHAFRLIISPDIPREEAAIARDTIWPAIEQHVLPGLKERLTTELTHSFADMDEDDTALLNTTVEDLRTELGPLEEELLNRLANRAWEVIGVSGVAEGIMRKTGEGAENTYKDVKDWVKSWWGNEEKSEKANKDFLTEERAAALRIALEEEVETFIKEKNTEIQKAFNTVLNARRADFIDKFETKWGPKLYEKALVPSWLEGEDGVLEAAEGYAADFAKRRLLTAEGGPRLLLAYALRSSLEITDEPLLVIAPDNSGKLEYEWIMPPLEKDGR
ncbi:MAG: hypothetical protein M5U25_09715 [Planctomycetota bacterium]|nr:hypothetical protein [Planctomycetota bacterium]